LSTLPAIASIEESNQWSFTTGITRITSQPLSSLHANATEDRRGSRPRNGDDDRGVRVEADKHVVASAATRFAVALQTRMPAPRARPRRS
jgi:hypothetical protein